VTLREGKIEVIKPYRRVSGAPGAAQTPKIIHFQSLKFAMMHTSISKTTEVNYTYTGM
jgi:hypothetical protein